MPLAHITSIRSERDTIERNKTVHKACPLLINLFLQLRIVQTPKKTKDMWVCALYEVQLGFQAARQRCEKQLL